MASTGGGGEHGAADMDSEDHHCLAEEGKAQ